MLCIFVASVSHAPAAGSAHAPALRAACARSSALVALADGATFEPIFNPAQAGALLAVVVVPFVPRCVGTGCRSRHVWIAPPVPVRIFASASSVLRVSSATPVLPFLASVGIVGRHHSGPPAPPAPTHHPLPAHAGLLVVHHGARSTAQTSQGQAARGRRGTPYVINYSLSTQMRNTCRRLRRLYGCYTVVYGFTKALLSYRTATNQFSFHVYRREPTLPSWRQAMTSGSSSGGFSPSGCVRRARRGNPPRPPRRSSERRSSAAKRRRSQVCIRCVAGVNQV